MTLSWDKFHPVLGDELRMALSLEVAIRNIENIRPTNRSAMTELFHKNDRVARYSFPAIVDGDIRLTDTARIAFQPWLEGEIIPMKYSLTFWAKEARRKDFWLWLGREGEKDPFTFNNPKQPYYITLVLRDRSRVKTFIPVAVVGRDPETSRILRFVIEAEDGPGKTIRLRTVGEDDLPRCLRGLHP